MENLARCLWSVGLLAALWAGASAEANKKIEPAEVGYVELAAVGDIRLDGSVGRLAAKEGPRAPTKDVREWLEADLLFGNLECALTSRGEKADKLFTFRASTANVSILKAAGFTIVSLANNHVMDYGSKGLEDTLAALDAAGILHVGAGRDEGEARRPVFIERNGLKIGFLAMTTTIPTEMYAGADKPGVLYADFKRFPAWIKDAKKRCDLLLVSYHGGTQLEPLPNEVQRAFMKKAFAAGADVVLGHHPHVIQPVEIPDGRLAIYSLANFLMVSPTPGTEWTAVARLRLARGGVSAHFLPVFITRRGAVEPADEKGAEIVRAALNRAGALDRSPEIVRFGRSRR